MGQNFSATTVVSGHVSPGYESVEEMFRGNLVSGKERNAQLCVYVGGECVVDLWGSAEGDLGYGGDSLQCVFSATKSVTAVCVAQMVECGLLDYHRPVASYWPQYGQGGKEDTRMEDVLRHEAGIPHLDTSVRLEVRLDGKG